MSSARAKYTKPVLTTERQLQILRARGLCIGDEPRALRYLNNIGYFRLSGYLISFEQATRVDGARDHQLTPGTTLDQVVDLYVFDRKLRMLVLEGIERVEVALRSAWANTLAEQTNDPHAWMNPANFDGSVEVYAQLAGAVSSLDRSREPFVRHYRSRYDTPRYPPAWAMVETLTFGELSKWLEHTPNAKMAVTRRLGLPSKELTQTTIAALAFVRNVCAHHGRCWDRVFMKALPSIKKLRHEFVHVTQKRPDGSVVESLDKHLYNYLVVLAFILNHLNPKSSWRARLVALVGERTPDQLKRMAFPADWHQRNVWVNPPREPAAVSGLEATLRDALRRHAAAQGITVADAHAAILRAALLPVTTA
ncbi:MAG: hypothetical protein RIT28_639 [Pseudomonadota bacterium]